MIREALNQLVSERLVVVQAHRGYRVATLSIDDLVELAEARIEVESLVPRMSIAKGDLEWEARAVGVHHVLEQTPFLVDTAEPAGTVNPEWVRVHAEYHLALLAGCGNERLLAAARQLRDEAELYQAWAVSLGHLPYEQIAAEHRELLAAAVARNAGQAGDILRTHLAHTAEAARAAWHFREQQSAG